MRVDAIPPATFPDTVEDIAEGATFFLLTDDGPVPHLMVREDVEDVMHTDVEPWPTRTALRLTDSVLVELDPWEAVCARALKLVEDDHESLAVDDANVADMKRG